MKIQNGFVGLTDHGDKIRLESFSKYDFIPNIWDLFEYSYSIEGNSLGRSHHDTVFARNAEEAKAKIYMHYKFHGFELENCLSPKIKKAIDRLRHEQMEFKWRPNKANEPDFKQAAEKIRW